MGDSYKTVQFIKYMGRQQSGLRISLTNIKENNYPERKEYEKINYHRL